MKSKSDVGHQMNLGLPLDNASGGRAGVRSPRDVAGIMAEIAKRRVSAGRRLPLPFWGTAAFLVLAVALMWGPTWWMVKSAMSLQERQGLTPALLWGPMGRGPGFSPRRPTEIRAASDGTRPVTFRLLAPAAREVLLGGSFNEFGVVRHPLVRGEEGIWELTLPLPPGRHTYKFKVDGEWLLDPTNPEKTPAPRERSIVDVPS